MFARHRPAELEVLLCLAAALIYFGIRSLTAGNVETAMANADWIMSLEQTAHLAWEEALQAPLVAHILLVNMVNWIYIWVHWPVIIVTAILLFIYRHNQYRLLRNAIFISGGIAFLFYILFPVAPPRLADPELVDTVTLYSHSYRALQPPGLTNQYAAFPSLHFGWNVLLGIAIWRATTNKLLRVAAVAQAVAMGAVVVMTANHYIVDVIGGLAVVLVGLAVNQIVVSRTNAKRRLA
ncbi:MAG: phosphatase PAP2 family protein [Thermoleophilia bacterium]